MQILVKENVTNLSPAVIQKMKENVLKTGPTQVVLLNLLSPPAAILMIILLVLRSQKLIYLRVIY